MKMRLVPLCEVVENLRFDASFHNAEINYYNKIIEAHSKYNLNHYCEKIYMSSRGRRCYATKTFGYPFLSNSDMMAQDPFVNCNYSSRKYGYYEDAVLKEGMILTGRVGAIGQTAFVPKFWENLKAMGSDNIIRICVKKEFLNGFIYAYLSSKFGYLSFWKHATGGVQPYITPEMVASLPIPQFSEKLQKRIDSLIRESADLRESAFVLMQKAQSLIQKLMHMNRKPLVHSVSLKKINESLNVRFEGNYYVGDGREIYNFIKKNLNSISLRDCTQKIFKPGIFKRSYVEKKGIPLLGGADIMKAIPSSNKLISKKQVASNSELKIEKDWILVTRAGTIGNIIYVDNQVAPQVVSEDVLRIVPKKDSYSGYIYAFLCSEYGKKMINMFTYGSVIQHVEAAHLEEVLIPQFEKKDMELIDDLTRQSVTIIESAKQKELQAISLVEKEIDGWKA